MTFFQLEEPIDPAIQEQEDSIKLFDPLVNTLTGVVKGFAGAVEGTLELATLFQVDIETNLGLGETEGFAQGLGSFAAELAAAFFTGGLAIAGGAKVASKAARLVKASSAARMFKGMPLQTATSLAQAISKRTNAAGFLLKGEAKFALGEFLTVTGDRGLDVVTMLGLDATDLGKHFAITDEKSEFEKRLVSGLNGLGFAAGIAGAIRGVGKAIKGRKAAKAESEERVQAAIDEIDRLDDEAEALASGRRRQGAAEDQRNLVEEAEFGAGTEDLKRVAQVSDQEKRLLDEAKAEHGDSVELRSHISREEVVAAARAAGVTFDSTSAFSHMTNDDVLSTLKELDELRGKIFRIDQKEHLLSDRGSKIKPKHVDGGIDRFDVEQGARPHAKLSDADIKTRRKLMDRMADLERGFRPNLQALARGKGTRGFVKLSLKPLRRAVNTARRQITEKLKPLLDTKEFDGVLERIAGVEAVMRAGARGSNMDLSDSLDYMQVLTPIEQAKYVQTIALSGRKKDPSLFAAIDLGREMNDIVDIFAEKQIRNLRGGADVSDIDIEHARITYRQHMANLMSDLSKHGDDATQKGTARDNLISIERIDSFHATYRAMKGEYFLADHVSARRVSGRRLAGLTNDEVAVIWDETPKWMKQRVETLNAYTEEIQKSIPSARRGEVLEGLLRLNDGTWQQKYRQLKVASIMTSLSLQASNVVSTGIRNMEEVMSEKIGGAITRRTRSARIKEAADSVPDSVRSGQSLTGLQLSSIQRMHFALVNMPQWFRAAQASFRAQGSVGVGPRISSGAVGSEEVSFGKSALGLSPKAEGILAFGGRLASAADDATKAAVVAQNITNNLFNTMLHVSGKGVHFSTRPEAFQNALMDAINAAVRSGDTITQVNMVGLVKKAAAQTGTLDSMRGVFMNGVANAHKKQVDQFIENSFTDMSKRGLQAAHHRTFTNLRDARKGKTIAKDQGETVAAGVRGVRWLAEEMMSDGVRAAALPFMNTPINVFLYGLDFTPLSKTFWDGLYTGAGGKDLFGELRLVTDLLDVGDINASRKVGRAVTGLTMMGGLLTAHQAELVVIRGAGPRDPVKNKAWRLAGNQKYSITVGGQSISFDRMGTMAMPFRLAADISDLLDNPYGVEGTDQAISNLIAASAETMLSGFLMEQAADMFGAVLSGDPKRMGRVLGSEAIYAVPAIAGSGIAAATGLAEGTVGASLLAMGAMNVAGQSAARIVDPSSAPKRDLDFVESIKASFFDRYKLFGKDKARNILGNPVTQRSGTQEFFGAAIGIARFATPENSTLATELAALSFPINPPLPTMMGLDLLNPAYAAGGRSAFDRYSEIVGQVKLGGRTLERALVDTIRSSRYRKMSREGITEAGLRSPRHEALIEVVARYRNSARKQIARERPALGRDIRDRKIAQTALLYGQSPEAITARFFPDL